MLKEEDLQPPFSMYLFAHESSEGMHKMSLTPCPQQVSSRQWEGYWMPYLDYHYTFLSDGLMPHIHIPDGLKV